MERLSAAMTSGVVLAVLVALLVPHPSAAIECGKNKSHNIFMGSRSYGDQMIYMDHPKKDGSWLRTVSVDTNTGPLNKLITYIELIDSYTDGNGGCAYLTNGGIGSNIVAFHIKSQRSTGVDFVLKVFGK